MAEVARRRWVARSVAVLVVGMLAGSVMLTPVGAHITTFNHLKTKHFYTKKAANNKFYAKADADAKFLDSGEGNTAFVNANELETKVTTSTTGFNTSSTTFVDVTSASATVTVPSGQSYLIFAPSLRSRIATPPTHLDIAQPGSSLAEPRGIRQLVPTTRSIPL